MGEHDGSGHEFFGFVGGEAEHDALVSGSLFFTVFASGGAGVYALRDVGGLAGEEVGDGDVVRMEDGVVLFGAVADFPYGSADDFLNVECSGGGDFSGEDDAVAFDEGFTCDAAGGVLCQAGVQNGVRDEVGYLVRVTFTDGFGCKDMRVFHEKSACPASMLPIGSQVNLALCPHRYARRLSGKVQ